MASQELPRVGNTVAVHLIFVVFVGCSLYVGRARLEPTKSWVLCNDPTISFPLRSETISTGQIVAFIFLIPPLVILIIEFLRWRRDEADWYPVEACTIFGRPIPKLVQCLWLSIGNYYYGAALMMLTVEFGKKTVGRLRPHFFAACNATDLTEICDPTRWNVYIYNITCTDPKKELTARESFPSAHSAGICFIAVFLLFYFQTRMSWESKLLPILRPTVQMIFFKIAFVVGLTRVRDHYHHYSDVAAGAVLGSVFALITVFYMSPLMEGDKRPRTGAAASDQSSVSSDISPSRAAPNKGSHPMIGVSVV